MNTNIYDELLNKNKELGIEQNKVLDQTLSTQNDLIKKQTDLNVKVLDQNKATVEQDFQKEAAAADVDYQKFINPYGVEAENQRANGLGGAEGYSETVQGNAYATSQLRVAVARAAMVKAKTDFDNQISQAYLTGDTNTANILLQTLQQKIAIAVREFEATSSIIGQKQAQTNWQTEYDAAQRDKATEQARWLQEFNYGKTQDQIAQSNWEREFALAKKGSSGSGKTSSSPKSLTDTPGADPKKLEDTTKKGGYFSNGYQPDNVDGIKLAKTGKTVSYVFAGKGDFYNQNIWSAGGRYYVWVSTGKGKGDYVDITSKYKSSVKNKVNYTWGR